MTPEKKWYAIKVKTNTEKTTVGLIRQELARNNKSDLVEEILLPTEKITQGKSVKEKNLIPGHVFLKISWNPELDLLLKNVTNVLGFITIGKTTINSIPQPIKQSEIDWLYSLHEKKPVEKTDLKINDSIKIKTGSFQGFSGRILEINETRIKAMVKFFEREIPLDINIEEIELNG